MALEREIMVGRRDRFAVKIAFLPDPDEGQAALPELAISWGAMEIWANGHNICRHVEQGESIDAVHWYLFPILRWLASNWDFLLHEERLPVRNAARDAWIAMQRTAEPPAALPEDETEQWEAKWHGWWERHSLFAAREGGLLPHLFIRRWRDQIELSWGDRPIAGAPTSFRFDALHGFARFPCGEVADVFYGVLDDASEHLLKERPESTKFGQLREDVGRLNETDHRRRLGLVSGFRADQLPPQDRWQQIEEFFPKLTSQQRAAVFAVEADPLVIKGASQVALMFGSLAPDIGEADARVLAKKLVQFYRTHGENDNLKKLVVDVPVDGSEERAWKQGYQLAEDHLEAVHDTIDRQVPVKIDELLQHLGVAVEKIPLNDRTVRAVALAGPQHSPAILVNENYEYQSIQPHRFTRAHELCHLLHDRNYGSRLALASGPWAPVDVEKRANAFAAMLLMPSDLVGSVVRRLDCSLDSPAGVWEVANTFQTSFSATLEHLCNLGHLDESTRDAMHAEMETTAAKVEASPKDSE